MTQPIELHFWPTPNGFKITIALHEMALPYELKLVNIGKGDQFKPEFLRSRRTTGCRRSSIPRGRTASRSRSSSRARSCSTSPARPAKFYGANERERVEVEEWLFWQVGGVGPMAGQANHFLRYAPSMDPPNVLPYAQNRYRNEVGRLYSVLNQRLADRSYVAGDYSIADMAIWPWARRWEQQEQDIARFPHMAAWLDRIAARPAVQARSSSARTRGERPDQGPRGAEGALRPDRPRLGARDAPSAGLRRALPACHAGRDGLATSRFQHNGETGPNGKTEDRADRRRADRGHAGASGRAPRARRRGPVRHRRGTPQGKALDIAESARSTGSTPTSAAPTPTPTSPAPASASSRPASRASRA